MRAGTSLTDVSRYNENVVIHALRRNGPSSQRDIAAETGLSFQTVSAIVRGLQGRGLLSEVRTEIAGRGRPKVIMDIVGGARFSVGVHVDPSLVSGVLLDLKGNVEAMSSSAEIDLGNPRRAMRDVGEMAIDMISGVDRQRIVGACLAMPGPLDSVGGAALGPVWLSGWSGVPVGALLGAELGMEVPVVKDTLAAVIGETWVRAGSCLDSTMIFVYIGTGIGLGLSVDGEPLRGASGNSGEVGAMLVALAGGGDRATAGVQNDPAILVERAHERGVLMGVAPARSDFPAVERSFEELSGLASGGDAGAVALLDEAAGRIGDLVVMATELLDADIVVFGGPYWRFVEDWYLPQTCRALSRPSARGPHTVEVSTTAMGAEVGAIGAASVVHDLRYVPRAPRAGRM